MLAPESIEERAVKVIVEGSAVTSEGNVIWIIPPIGIGSVVFI